MFARVFGIMEASNLGMLISYLPSALAFYACCRMLGYKRIWSFVTAILFGFTFIIRGGTCITCFFLSRTSCRSQRGVLAHPGEQAAPDRWALVLVLHRHELSAGTEQPLQPQHVFAIALFQHRAEFLARA